MRPSTHHRDAWVRLGVAVAGGYLGARALEQRAVRVIVRKALALAASALVREALLAWRDHQAELHGHRPDTMH
jgi:hypothetical protein